MKIARRRIRKLRIHVQAVPVVAGRFLPIRQSLNQIVKVCVRNAQPVEYGQVLYQVRPA